MDIVLNATKKEKTNGRELNLRSKTMNTIIRRKLKRIETIRQLLARKEFSDEVIISILITQFGVSKRTAKDELEAVKITNEELNYKEVEDGEGGTE